MQVGPTHEVRDLLAKNLRELSAEHRHQAVFEPRPEYAERIEVRLALEIVCRVESLAGVLTGTEACPRLAKGKHAMADTPALSDWGGSAYRCAQETDVEHQWRESA